jgi:hypothetical protein
VGVRAYTLGGSDFSTPSGPVELRERGALYLYLANRELLSRFEYLPYWAYQGLVAYAGSIIRVKDSLVLGQTLPEYVQLSSETLSWGVWTALDWRRWNGEKLPLPSQLPYLAGKLNTLEGERIARVQASNVMFSFMLMNGGAQQWHELMTTLSGSKDFSSNFRETTRSVRPEEWDERFMAFRKVGLAARKVDFVNPAPVDVTIRKLRDEEALVVWHQLTLKEDKAEEFLEQALSAYPNHGEALLLSGRSKLVEALVRQVLELTEAGTEAPTPSEWLDQAHDAFSQAVLLTSNAAALAELLHLYLDWPRHFGDQTKNLRALVGRLMPVAKTAHELTAVAKTFARLGQLKIARRYAQAATDLAGTCSHCFDVRAAILEALVKDDRSKAARAAAELRLFYPAQGGAWIPEWKLQDGLVWRKLMGYPAPPGSDETTQQRTP